MSSTILTIGATAAESDPFTLNEGEVTTIFLIDANGGQSPMAGSVSVQIEDSVGEVYMTVGALNRKMPAAQICGPGTYRVQRMAQATAVGVARA